MPTYGGLVPETTGEEMPCHAGVTMADMSLEPLQTQNFGRSGESTVVTYGLPRWRLAVKTTRLDLEEARIWDGFFQRRRGVEVSFSMFRLFRANPQGLIGNPDGALTINAYPENSSIKINGVGSGQVRTGDMISYRAASGHWWLGVAVADADPVNGDVTVAVEPRPATPHATPEVRRVKALGEFKLVNPPPPFEDYVNRNLQFEAEQVMPY